MQLKIIWTAKKQHLFLAKVKKIVWLVVPLHHQK